ncbi:hypothetical protein D3C71_1839140 [compost metagenome]
MARFSSIAALAIRLGMTAPLGNCRGSKGDMGLSGRLGAVRRLVDSRTAAGL